MVWLTDRPDMTLDVYRGCKTTPPQTPPIACKFLDFLLICMSLVLQAKKCSKLKLKGVIPH